MRRRGIAVLLIAVIAAAFVGTWVVAKRAGEADGRSKVLADRSAFLSRAGANPQGGAAGGSSGTTGGASGASGTRGPSGSVVAPAGASGTGSGSSPVGAAGGSASAGGARTSAIASSIAGRVTKIDGTTVSVQQTDNATVAVTTNSDTAIRKLVAGALTDLKTGDVIAVDGAKTGDAAYSAKTITSLGQGAGGASGGANRPPNAVPQGVPGPAVTGQIKSMTNGTITVQGFDGATVTVTSSPATVVKTQQPGTLSDIKPGDLLFVQGDTTGDTGFLARSITNQGASSG